MFLTIRGAKSNCLKCFQLIFCQLVFQIFFFSLSFPVEYTESVMLGGMLLCEVRTHMIMVRFLAGHLTPSEASAVKDTTHEKTLTTQSELEQLDVEVRRVFIRKIEVGTRLRLL